MTSNVILLVIGVLFAEAVSQILMFHDVVFEKVLHNFNQERLMFLPLVCEIDQNQFKELVDVLLKLSL